MIIKRQDQKDWINWDLKDRIGRKSLKKLDWKNEFGSMGLDLEKWD